MVLDREDVDDLISEFADVGEVCHVSTDEWEDVDPSRLTDIGEAAELEISIAEPKASLRVESGRIVFHAEETSFRTRGLLARVRDVLDRKGRTRFRTLRQNAVFVGISLFAISVGAMFRDLELAPFASIGHIMAGVAVSLVILAVAMYERRTTSRIRLVDPAPGFWARNKDKVVLMLLSVGLGAVTTAVVQRMFL